MENIVLAALDIYILFSSYSLLVAYFLYLNA